MTKTDIRNIYHALGIIEGIAAAWPDENVKSLLLYAYDSINDIVCWEEVEDGNTCLGNR